jgi:hypothetical protein
MINTMQMPSGSGSSYANALPPKKRPATTTTPTSSTTPDAPDDAADHAAAAAAALATRMLLVLPTATTEAERAAENKAALRAALGKRVRELVGERVSTAEATATKKMASSSRGGGGSGSSSGTGAQMMKKPSKVLQRPMIRARYPEGRCMGGAPPPTMTAEERSSLARAVQRARQNEKAALEMAENKAERRREKAEQAKEEEEDERRTPEERERDEEEADALHERLRRETPFASHHERRLQVTNGAQYYRVMPRLSAEHPRLEEDEGLDDDHSLVFVVDADRYEPPTYHSFKDIRRRTIGSPLTELPFTCRFGADLVFHETEKSKVRRAKLYGMHELRSTFDDPQTPDDKKKAEMPGGHLAVRREGIFVSRWPLRGANREGHARFLRSFDTVAENRMERAEIASETRRMGTHISLRC